jgi:RHS repeat-associated protein
VTVAVVTDGSLKHWNLTLPGGEVIGRRTSGSGKRYYLKDHQGSIRAVLDGGGGVRETRDYYPFGLPMPGRYEKGSPPTKEDFTGHVKDEATGLHYAGARYYSSAFGRWTTTDPILREQSPAKLLKDGKVRAFSMSAYNYSFNNPVKFKDETGEYPTPWDIADFGAAAHSIYQAVQNPSASNIGWAAADVGAAALPIVPSTKGARLVAKHGDDAIQAVKAGIGKSDLAQQFAKGAKALGKAANKAESISELKKLGKVSGKQIELKAGTGTKIAKSLTGAKSLETSKDGASKYLKNVDIGGKKAKRVSVYKGSGTTGGPSVQIKWKNGKELKIRVPNSGFSK